MEAEIVVVQKSFFETYTGLNLVFSHFVALLGVAGFMILVWIGILQDRYRRRRRQLATIPRDEMPILRSRDLSKTHLKLILNEIVNSKNTKIEAPIDVSKSLQQNLSSGDAGAGGDTIHYKTSVLHSITILEKAALHVDKSLQRDESSSVSSYLKLLRSHVVELTEQLCDAYVDVYTKARLGADPMTSDEYATFIKNFFEMIRAFERQERRNRGLPVDTTTTTTTTQQPAPSSSSSSNATATNKKSKKDKTATTTATPKPKSKEPLDATPASTIDSGNQSPPSDIEMQPLAPRKRKPKAK